MKVKSMGNKPNLQRRSDAARLYLEGLTLRQVAVKLGITYQAVHALLKRGGVPLRPRGGSTGAHSRHKK